MDRYGRHYSRDFNAIMGLLKDDQLKKEQIRFFLGYSGWASEQLEQELEVSSWVVVPNTYKNDILSKSNNNLWKEKMLEFGGDYLIWSNAPEDPTNN